MNPKTLMSAHPAGVFAKDGCYICLENTYSDRYGPLVDTGVNIETEGGLILCGRCVHNLARLIGMADGSDVRKVAAENVALKGEVANLRMTNGKLKKALDALREVDDALREQGATARSAS